MKMDFIGFSCVFSFLAAILLQGCSLFEGEEPADAQSSSSSFVPPPAPPPAPLGRYKKAVCQCGQNYGCQGGGSWCDQMEKVCGKCKENCQPNCAWSCESPKCAQACGPKCKAPKCSVRCKGFNTHACRMECGKPNCRVVCPKIPQCGKHDCPKCKTECSKPVCQVACKKGIGDEQPCRNVCSQPVCHWNCKHPKSCPKPKCSMKCEAASDCMSAMLPSGETPPLEPGETEVATVDVPVGTQLTQVAEPGDTKLGVQSTDGFKNGDDITIGTGSTAENNQVSGFSSILLKTPLKYKHEVGTVVTKAVGPAPAPGPAPAAIFLQGQGLSSETQRSRMRINITSMGADGTLQTSEVSLAMTQFDATQSRGTSWVKELREEFGEEKVIEASCTRGKFQCEGDAEWCAEQKEIICKGSERQVLRSHRQSALQA